MSGVIAIVILLLLLSVVATVVISLRSSKKAGEYSGQPACGSCGYPTQGISELKCPECGADLTVVGIHKSGTNNAVLHGCIVMTAYSVVCLLLSVLLFAGLMQVLPTYGKYNLSIDATPQSGEYDNFTFEVSIDAVSSSVGGMPSSGISTSTQYGGGTTTSSMTFSALDPAQRATIREVRLMVTPLPSKSPGLGNLNIDPQTRQANWIDPATMQQQTSSGPFTDQDVLAYLGSMGADTTNAAVITESQQLAQMIDNLLSGSNQATLTGFNIYSTGSGGSTSQGPRWLLPVYAVAWLLIWITGLLIIGWRGRNKAT